MRALLLLSKTPPAVGNKGVLFCSPPGATGDAEWVQLGEVEVKTPLDGAGRIQLKMVDDEKKFVVPGGKRPSPLSKSTRVRLRWEF